MLSTAALCLALNIYHEGRDQTVEGRKAIAAVTMTRANNQQSKICDVVFKPRQFSWADPLTTVSKTVRQSRASKYIPKEGKAWEEAKSIAKLALSGRMVTQAKNAAYFYNPKLASPAWRTKFVVVAKIDDHIFMK